MNHPAKPKDVRHPLSLWRILGLSLAWQAIPAGYLLWTVWDYPSTRTFVLWGVVFLAVPAISSLVHRSWQVGLAAMLLPILAMGVMFTVFLLIMPTIKW